MLSLKCWFHFQMKRSEIEKKFLAGATTLIHLSITNCTEIQGNKKEKCMDVGDHLPCA